MKLRVPEVGERAPSVEMTSTDGRFISLARLSGPVILTFLRHLA